MTTTTSTTTAAIEGTVIDADGNAVDALTQLPHSGLRVPHTLLRVTAYRPMRGPDGIAFTATLRYEGNPVATIQNEGFGGETWVQFHPGVTFRPEQWDEFVQHCRAGNGEPTDSDQVAADLVTEFETGTNIRRAGLRGNTLCRRMGFIYSGPEPRGDAFPDQFIEQRRPTSPAERDGLATYLDTLPASEHGWWEMWNGTAWEQMTRPALPAHQH